MPDQREDAAAILAGAKALHELIEERYVKPGRRLSWDSPIVDRESYIQQAAVVLLAARSVVEHQED